jgi:hypothetical protein
MTALKPIIDTAETPGEASSKAAAIRRALACTPARDRYVVKVEARSRASRT